MKLTLLCERCNVRNVKTKVGVFNYEDLKWPLDCSIFKSWNPQLLPDPFPAGRVDDWTWARCRTCGARPFLNLVPQPDGKVMIVTGERIEQGYEGNVLTLEHGYVPIPGYPGQKLGIDNLGNVGHIVKITQEAEIVDNRKIYSGKAIITDDEGNEGQVVEQLTQDPPQVQDKPKDGPVSCPACGKEYQSQANMDRYHNCPKKE